MSTLMEHLETYKPFTAIVIGDFMLDQSVHGAAERLSPDAPVPVLVASRFEDHPGGFYRDYPPGMNNLVGLFHR